jgi:hypothetical protein
MEPATEATTEEYVFEIISGEYHGPDERVEDGQGPFILVQVKDPEAFRSFLAENKQSYGRVFKGGIEHFMINGIPGWHQMADGTINYQTVVGSRRKHCWYLQDPHTLIWAEYNPIRV